MKRLFGKETNVENYSKLHVELVYGCVHQLKEVMEHFYEQNFDLMDDEVEEITRIEHEADEIRRKMEIEFYQGAFLPFDREDRIVLAELVDAVADATQSAAYAISLGKIKFPKIFKDDFVELVEASCEAVSVLRESVKMLDTDLRVALDKAHEVEEKEEAGDKIERKIIPKLYDAYRNNEIGILTFIELKDITQKIGNIADRSEDASDRVPIMVAKRKG
ncbi:TIGR00153 family protein [Methanobacterium oryzae]|uniref:TIGR00153 family protein n=1 Tax=Methanobacterium oryzae TaxID=69540 RepID=UPI003D201BB6